MDSTVAHTFAEARMGQVRYIAFFDHVSIQSG